MSLKKQAISGVLWTFAQQFSTQIISFVVKIVLARLLLPEEFGLIAMISVFMAVGTTLIDGGMTSSLIRTKKPDRLDYSTVFYTNFLVSILVYLITYLSAPFVAAFYDQNILKNLLRVYSLTFIIGSFIAIPMAKLTKEMNFKLQMTMQIPSLLISSVIGIYLAFKGYGVWSLVYMSLIQSIVLAIQVWLFTKWRPLLVFNKRRFKYHLGFGYKLAVSGLLDTVYRNIYNIVVGKYFSPSLVGYFNQAENWRTFPVNQLSSAISKVTYPLFSNIKNDDELRNAYKKTMLLVFFVIVPIMFLLFIIAKPLFLIVLGEKWLPAVVYFKILVFASIVRPLSTYNLNILKVKGRSDLLLKLEVIKKSIGFIAVFVAVPFGLLFMVYSYLVVTYISALINMYFCGRYIDYPLFSQIKDSKTIFIIGLAALLISILFNHYIMLDNDYLYILINSLLFLGLYFSLSFIYERSIIRFIHSIILRK